MRWPAILAAAGVVLVLSACSPQDHAMVSLDEGALVFMSCQSITGVQHISVGLYDGDMWHARGEDGSFGPGVRIKYGVAPPGFETDIGPGSLSLDDERVQFTLINTAVDEVAVVFDGNAIVEGKWLDQNGNLHDEPCSR